MGFSETIFLFFLALLIFGPKKLPEIARMVGKAMNEFKRASNEFRSQIESEISNLELDKERQILPPAIPPVGSVAALSLSPEPASKADEAGSELQSLPPLPPGQIPYAKAPDA
jgi:sec-independent protein translocase protein TatB